MDITFRSDKTGSDETMEGSDNRANVSARSDNRSYYASRDSGQAWSLVFSHTAAAAGEFSVYWKNTHSSLHLVLDSAGLNSVQASTIKAHFVSGTATGGATITPVNLNATKSTLASSVATCLQGLSGDAVTGITSTGVFDLAFVQATGHEEMRFSDRIRIGPGDAVALEYDTGTAGIFAGVIYGFYEEG